MFAFRDGSLHAESVPLESIASEYGTPCYVYSRAALSEALTRFHAASGAPSVLCDVVGPICESADFLGRGRELAVREGDLFAAMSAGAYAMSMSSNYSSRPRAAEVMVDGIQTNLIRARERPEALYALEHLVRPG